MTRDQAEQSARYFRSAGYDVQANRSPIGAWDWELTCRPVEPGNPLHYPTASDCTMACTFGLVARIGTKP